MRNLGGDVSNNIVYRGVDADTWNQLEPKTTLEDFNRVLIDAFEATW